MSIAFRGIWGRRGVTATILVVAVVATAAATVGPVYFEAAGSSILQDTVRTAPALGQGVDIYRQADLSGNQLDDLSDGVKGLLGSSPAASAFGKPINAVEFSGHLAGQPAAVTTVVAWREAACAHLVFSSGSCPGKAGQVVASTKLQHKLGLRIGQRLNANLMDTANNPIPLTITGFYRPVDPFGQYWMSRPYFQVLTNDSGSDRRPQYTDGLFTPRSTFADAAPYSGGIDVVDLPINFDSLSYTSSGPVTALVAALSAQLPQTQVTTTLPTVLGTASTSQQALAAPVFLVSIQLLVLCWLLLFLLVTDAAEARGNEVALAKLRGLTTCSDSPVRTV